LRVVTLNVNGIRSAAKKGLFRWLAARRADVVCLQEIKCQEPDLDARLHGLKAFTACHAFAIFSVGSHAVGTVGAAAGATG